MTEAPSPSGRITPDPDGTLRLRFVALPPRPGSPDAQMAARPETDQINVALTLSANVLAGVEQVQITGATNTVTLRK